MSTTSLRPPTHLDLTSPTRLASAAPVLVGAGEVRAVMGEHGWDPGEVDERDEERFNAYAALLLCATPKAAATAPEEVSAPGHEHLTRRLEQLSGLRLGAPEAAAVGQVLGVGVPSMTVREARWLFNLCTLRRTQYGRELVARPREWVALEERLGIYVELGVDYGPGMIVTGIHRTDPRAGSGAEPLRPGPYTDKALEFGGDWQAVIAGFRDGFSGRSHRLARELMVRLREHNYSFSPRLVRDTVEVVIHDHRYTVVGAPGFAHGKARMRLDVAAERAA